MGTSNEQEVEIIQGLQVGDMVILDNLSRLRAGMAVDIAQEGK